LAYKAVDGAMAFLHLFPPFRALMLVALPGALQSVFAALGDFYTWKLAMDIYGRESNAPWAAVSYYPGTPSSRPDADLLSSG
jgi:phosphatidylinositol glycan class B